MQTNDSPVPKTKEESLANITKSADALAGGRATYSDYVNVHGSLTHCLRILKNDPKRGFEEELRQIQVDLKRVLDRLHLTNKNVQSMWQSPFTTLQESGSISLLMFLLNNQFLALPKLDPNQRACVEQNMSSKKKYYGCY